MTCSNVALAQNLRQHLRSKNLSQSHFAKRIGMSTATLHGYLYGITPQGLENLVKIADYFSLSLDELVFKGETHHD